MLVASEPIDENSVNVGAITLQNEATNPSANFTLTLSIFLRLDVTSIVIRIAEDLNTLKSLDICTVEGSCFLTHSDGVVADIFGEEAINITVGLSPSEFEGDDTDPTLRRFLRFDRGTGLIAFSFSETILTESFVPTRVTLQSLNTDLATVGLSMHVLTGGDLITQGNSLTVTVQLTDEDMAAIRLNPFLCTSRGNCFVRMATETFTDVAGNPLLFENNGILVDEFIFDDVPPALTNFSLDIDNSQLALTFSEPVTAESFRVTGIALQGSRNSSTSYSLATSFTSSADGVEIIVNISDSDLNMLKASGFFTSASDTFITIDESATRT